MSAWFTIEYLAFQIVSGIKSVLKYLKNEMPEVSHL